MRRAILWGLGWSSVLFLVGSLVWRVQGYGFVWNKSPSLPIGLYSCRQLAATTALKPWDIVIFHLTPPQHGLLPQIEHSPMLKMIITGSPHMVCLDGDEFRIDGAWWGARPLRALVPQSPPFCQALEEESYFVLGQHPRSYDSRYYGPIQRAQITATCAPLWTWEDQ